MNDPTDLGTRCVLGDLQEPHSAALGLLTCLGHQEALRTALVAMLDTMTRIAILPAPTGNPTGGRSGSLASHRSVLDLETLALAGPQADGELSDHAGWDGADPNHPLAVAGTWARMIREERHLRAPSGPANLSTEVGTILFDLDWCCAQPWVDEMVAELGPVFDRVRRADPERVRPGDEGRCPAVGMGPGGTCGGRLRRERGATPWLVRDDRCERVPIDVHAGVVRCQQCGMSWEGPEAEEEARKKRAEKAMEAARPRDESGHIMLTAAELGMRHSKTKRAMQERLKRRNITPVMRGGIGWYPADVFDVEEVAG